MKKTKPERKKGPKSRRSGKKRRKVAGLRPNQEKAIPILLESVSIKAAAEKMGIGYRTLRDWLDQPAFAKAYREARRALVESGVTLLQQGIAVAAGRLLKNLSCGVPAVENQAAVKIFDLALRGTEVLDLIPQVEELRTLVDHANQYPHLGPRSSPAPKRRANENGEDDGADSEPVEEGPSRDHDGGLDGPGPVAGPNPPEATEPAVTELFPPGG
jgi:hypothetical protein